MKLSKFKEEKVLEQNYKLKQRLDAVEGKIMEKRRALKVYKIEEKKGRKR